MIFFNHVDNIFVIKLVITFVTSAFWITLTSVIAEKYGSKLGGVLSGFPSSIAIALFFIGWTHDANFAIESATVVPLMAGINGFFVICYLYLLKYNFATAILSAFLLWFSIVAVFLLSSQNNFVINITVCMISWIICNYIAEYKLKIISEGTKKVNYTWMLLGFRAILSGSIISFAVILAKVAGPIAGGIFANFPSIMTATMIISYFAHGAHFSAAVMKPLMFTGMINAGVYATAVYFTYKYYGLYAGTLISCFVVMFSTYFIYLFVKRKMI